MIESRAVVFVAPRQVEVRTIQLPDPQPNDVVVRTLYSGVSAGTELWSLTGRYWSTQFPTVPGYQKVGVVERVGPAVGAYRPGDRVYLRFTRVTEGTNVEWAGHTEYSVISADAPEMFRIPDGLDAVEGSQLCVAAVGYHGAAEVMPVEKGQTVAVIGLGMIGQFSAQTAALNGAQVIALDLIERRLKLAEQLAGARIIPPGANAAETIKQWHPQGLDAVIDTSAHAETINASFHWLRPRGRYCFQGYYPDKTSLDLLWPHAKELVFYNPTNCTVEGQKRVADELAGGRMRMKELITHVLPAAEAPRAYEMLLEKRPDVMGVVIDWQ